MNIKKAIVLCLLCGLGTPAMSCKKEGSSQSQNENPNPNKAGFEFNEEALIKANYIKVFEDDFSIKDLSKWEVWNGGAYNKELQLYQDHNMSIDNGILVIRSKRERANGETLPESGKVKTFDFTSGRIDSKFTFTSSDATPKIRIVARIQLPAGKGMWPALWANGDNWPTTGEIDIMEAMGEPFSYQTDYFYGKDPEKIDTNDQLTMKPITSKSNLTTQFHVYEVIWEKNSLTYLLDGEVVDIKRSADPGGQYITAFYGKLQHVTLNLAVGGQMFGEELDPATIQPGAMYVDWIRIYTAK